MAEVRESGSVVAEFLYAIDDTRVRRKVDDTYTFYHADGTEYSFDAEGGEGYFTYYHQMSGRMVEVPVRGVIDEMHRRLVDQAIGRFVP